MRRVWTPETNSKLAQLPPWLVLQMCNLWVRVDGLRSLGCFGPIPWLGVACSWLSLPRTYRNQRTWSFWDLSGHGMGKPSNLCASSMFFFVFFWPPVGKLMFFRCILQLPATLHSLLVVSQVRFPVFIACFIYLELVVWRGPDRQ